MPPVRVKIASGENGGGGRLVKKARPCKKKRRSTSRVQRRMAERSVP